MSCRDRWATAGRKSGQDRAFRELAWTAVRSVGRVKPLHRNQRWKSTHAETTNPATEKRNRYSVCQRENAAFSKRSEPSMRREYDTLRRATALTISGEEAQNETTVETAKSGTRSPLTTQRPSAYRRGRPKCLPTDFCRSRDPKR